ncbi:Glycosyltransferase family 15 protein [Mycena chlorophos]|uniref:Glycosyltransferase family 15 protein n=1 Tax=Mycena chlorophos TaxID=658473 RepID=A0A8H6TS46_MYCCL|nr:Glycosyltransferase family 15 protein [Mycena chlorophos]
MFKSATAVVTPRRIVAVLLATILSIHFLIHTANSSDSLQVQLASWSFTKMPATHSNKSNSAAPVESTLASLPVPSPMHPAAYNAPPSGRANATFVFLARNSDIDGVAAAVQSVEDRFNRRHGYPWVFLNDEYFTEQFMFRVRLLTDAPVFFGRIERDAWNQPDWIDEEKARKGRLKLMSQRIIYGGYVPYRNMCRFNSGFFFKHELLQQYRYYWRVEPGVKYFCDLSYDPFKMMQEQEKVYGFTISLMEHKATVATLWQAVKEFIEQHPEHIDPNNALDFVSDDAGANYNLCHFWSNFEIADMDFWRAPAYQAFFDFLEAKGGFYYERWGDAPVHSIAAALFARRDQIHFFRDIAYRHDDFEHCPAGEQYAANRCSCNPDTSFDYTDHSCLRRFENLFS